MSSSVIVEGAHIENRSQGSGRGDRQASSYRSMPRLGAVAILFAALVWRLLGITQTEVWRDEAITLIHARASWWDLLTRVAWVEDTPPLVFLLFKAWSLCFVSEWALRLLPVLLGVATVGVLMKLAAEIHPRAWWPVGLLAAFSHVPVHFSQELRVYSLLSLVTVLCLWAAERASRNQWSRRWTIGLGILGALAAHCHAVGIFVYPMVLVYGVIRDEKRAWLRLSFGAGPIVWLFLSSPMIGFGMHWASSHAVAGDWWIELVDRYRARMLFEEFFGLKVLDSWAKRYPVAGVVWTTFAIERLLMFAPALLVCAGLCDRQLRRPVLALACSPVFYVTMIVVGSIGTVPSILVRTLLPVWWPVVLGVGLGGAAKTPSIFRRWPVAIVVVLSLAWAGTWCLQVYRGLPRRHVTAPAFTYLRARLGPNDLVFSSPYWFEDQTVYRLGDCVSADQLFCSSRPVYAGQPPHHKMVPRVADPQWLDRLVAAAHRQRQTVGSKHRIWVVQFGWFGRISIPDDVDTALCRTHRRVPTLEQRPEWPVILACYVPNEPTISSPASGRASSAYLP